MAKKKGKGKGKGGTRRRRRTGLPLNMQTAGMVAAGAGLAAAVLPKVLPQLKVDPKVAYGGMALGGVMLATRMKKDKALAALGLGIAAIGAANLVTSAMSGSAVSGLNALPSGPGMGQDVLAFQAYETEEPF